MSQETQKWMDGKFIEWRNRQPRGEDTVERFADYLGVSVNSVNNWLNRGSTPVKGSVTLIAMKLGMEIYDLVGLPRPDPVLQFVIENWGNLPNEYRERIGEMVQAAVERAVDRRNRARVVVSDAD